MLSSFSSFLNISCAVDSLCCSSIKDAIVERSVLPNIDIASPELLMFSIASGPVEGVAHSDSPNDALQFWLDVIEQATFKCTDLKKCRKWLSFRISADSTQCSFETNLTFRRENIDVFWDIYMSSDEDD